MKKTNVHVTENVIKDNWRTVKSTKHLVIRNRIGKWWYFAYRRNKC